MKPLLEDIGKKRGADAFLAFEIQANKLEFFWHYHPEYELTLIVEGKGTRLIGDHHANFESGDLVLIGPGLPHTWVSDNSSKEKSKAIVIQFSVEFIKRFAELTEMTNINQLLLSAQLGISMNENNLTLVHELIHSLPSQKGLQKVTNLLQLLEEIALLKNTSLASIFYQPLKGSENEKRINKVCQFIQKHAAEPINIHNAAARVHLTPSAFCKFFKRATGKTFSDYVNDIRIANVCNDLLATDKQIAEIAYENGFETLTYFNRIFLLKKNMCPSHYRKVGS